MRTATCLLSALALALPAITGCKIPRNETGNLKTAIDNYYDQRPECLWTNSVQLPQTFDEDDLAHVRQFDALASVGLVQSVPLTRMKSATVHKPAKMYDLTDKGRANWRRDPSRTGYGNFCYAHREVKQILHNTQAGIEPGAMTHVSYSYEVGSIKDWADSDQVQEAFPWIVRTLHSTGTADENLVLTKDGWKVQSASTKPGTTN
ncbi:hypothetical protein [Terriglobus sp. RCC_193]|uniref:hypothetical protein n=1 Tax=Terriglobus sp. RCC_193 TaxID=3239218 RepID=UPI0035232F84